MMMKIGCQTHGQQWSLSPLWVLLGLHSPVRHNVCHYATKQLPISQLHKGNASLNCSFFFVSLICVLTFCHPWLFPAVIFLFHSSEYSSDSLALWSCILPGGTPWQLCFPVSPPGVRHCLCCRHLFTCFRHWISEFNNQLAVDLRCSCRYQL